MERIIGLPKQNVGRRISIKRRLRLAVMIAAIFAAGILVGAAKRPIWNLIVGEDSKQVAFDADTSAAQKTMGLAYTLTEIPEGYTLADKHITPNSACEYYMTDSGSYIFFTQETVSNFEQYSAGDAKGEYYTLERYFFRGGNAVYNALGRLGSATVAINLLHINVVQVGNVMYQSVAVVIIHRLGTQ